MISNILYILYIIYYYIYYYVEANDFYIIDNSKTVTDILKNYNFKGGRKNISTYDFKTLYTHIPHQLNSNLKTFVDRVFTVKGKKYLKNLLKL